MACSKGGRERSRQIKISRTQNGVIALECHGRKRGLRDYSAFDDRRYCGKTNRKKKSRRDHFCRDNLHQKHHKSLYRAELQLGGGLTLWKGQKLLLSSERKKFKRGINTGGGGADSSFKAAKKLDVRRKRQESERVFVHSGAQRLQRSGRRRTFKVRSHRKGGKCQRRSPPDQKVQRESLKGRTGGHLGKGRLTQHSGLGMIHQPPLRGQFRKNVVKCGISDYEGKATLLETIFRNVRKTC